MSHTHNGITSFNYRMLSAPYMFINFLSKYKFISQFFGVGMGVLLYYWNVPIIF